jgi:hypothetical protein
MKKLLFAGLLISSFSTYNVEDEYFNYLLNEYSEKQEKEDICKWAMKKGDIYCEFCHQEGNDIHWFNDSGVHNKCFWHVVTALQPISNVICEHLDSLNDLRKYYFIITQSVVEHLKQQQKNPLLNEYKESQLTSLFKVHGIPVLEKHLASQEKKETAALVQALQKMRQETEGDC